MQQDRTAKTDVTWKGVRSPVDQVLTAVAANPPVANGYLAGGTGLSVQLGHRISLDVDLFVHADSIRTDPILARLEATFSDSGFTVAMVDRTRQVDVLVGRPRTRLTVLAYPFPLLYPLKMVNGLACASVRDIAAMKAYALGRRTAARDFVDLHHLLVATGAVTLQEVIDDATRKYTVDRESWFSAHLFLRQLVNSDGVDDVDALADIAVDPNVFPALIAELGEVVREYQDQVLG